MSSVDKLTKLAERFARKISLAQSAQAGEIASVLKDKGVWGVPDDLFPLADAADVPGGVFVQFQIVVDSGLNVVFRVQPPPPAGVAPASLIKMTKLIKDKFGPGMQQALKTGQIKEYDDKGQVKSQRPVTVSGSVVVGWHSIK